MYSHLQYHSNSTETTPVKISAVQGYNRRSLLQRQQPHSAIRYITFTQSDKTLSDSCHCYLSSCDPVEQCSHCCWGSASMPKLARCTVAKQHWCNRVRFHRRKDFIATTRAKSYLTMRSMSTINHDAPSDKNQIPPIQRRNLSQEQQ